MSIDSAIPQRELYYITHIENLLSIIENGIFSHEIIESRSIVHTKIYDNDIVINRSEILTPAGKDLWSYANLYLQPRNPMMYRVVQEKGASNIVIVAIKKSILNLPNIYLSNGNAASSYSEIRSIDQLGKTYKEIKEDLRRTYWQWQDGSKRKIMAEILVPDQISPEYIDGIYVANHEAREKVLEIIGSNRIPIIPQPSSFFQPIRFIPITSRLSIVDGDMFFSRLQTLTISVNIVGVMGKGIASRAKYQFPDVYVFYQDLCRNKQLKLGKPYLYKRESSFDSELADEPNTMINANHTTWFLLFPTKDHWRNDSSIEGIEKGLQWLEKNYKKLGIDSMAIPALGCGLGRLEWADVGPLMCKYLSKLDATVQIYLPLEREIPQHQLTKEFCLST